MANPQQDDDFADIHSALGIQSTSPADLIGQHPVLQLVPTSGMAGRGAAPPQADQTNLPAGYRSTPGDAAGHYLYAPNGDLLSWHHTPYDLRQAALSHQALETHGTPPEAASASRPSIEDVLASPTKEGFNALTSSEQKDYMSRVFFNSSNGLYPYSALSTHMDNLLGPTAGLNARTSPPGRSAALRDWVDDYYAARSDSTRPSLSDASISAHLAQNPGASIADVAGISSPTAAPARTPLASQLQTTSGPLGELPAAVRDNITQRIGPHMSESDFADKFFGGMFHPDNFTAGNGGEISSMGNSLTFAGKLRDPVSGQNIGSLNRTIGPDYAYHGYLNVQPNARGTGAVPAMLSNQVDLYKKMGLSEVRLGANIDVGSYAWAKYGFVPKTQGDWDHLRGRTGVGQDWQQMKPHVDPDQAEHVDRILSDPDPHAIWDLADVPYKAPQGWGRDENTTIGKALLMNKSWSGKLDLNGADSMARFNDYVASKMK